MKKIICYATNHAGSGIPQKVGEWSEVSDIRLRLDIFQGNTVLEFEEDDGDEPLVKPEHIY